MLTQAETAARAKDAEAQAAITEANQGGSQAAGESEADKKKAADAVEVAKAAKQVTADALTQAEAARKAAAQTREKIEHQLETDGIVATTSGRWSRLDRLIGTSIDTRLLLIVMISGAMGTAIYAATAFSLHVARLDFGRSWLWWYVLRFPVGIGLAVIVYFVIRGGLFAGTFANEEAVASTANPYGFAALSALSGMFAEQASDKVKEIFEGIFRTSENKGFKTSKPVIDPLSPILTGASGTALEIAIRGYGFDRDAKVTVNGTERPAKMAADYKTLTMTLGPADVAQQGEMKIQVVNPADRGGPSAEAILRVVSPPSIISVSPVKAGAKEPIVVAVRGGNFNEQAKVFVGDVEVGVEFVSSKELSVTLPPNLVAKAGILKVKVVNPPEAADGESDIVDLTVAE